MRRLTVVMLVAFATLLSGPAAFACGGLVAPNGAVRLVRTSTLAAYVDGVEHYVTSFEFGSTQRSFGSIVPLPGVPTKVQRGGDWTLQRLQREVNPPPPVARGLAVAAAGAERDSAEVLLETRIDALDITILRGGGIAVTKWAKQQGFSLSQDTPEVLDFYARRSPIFMAARFDAKAARADGVTSGDGTPIHLTIPTDAPWVPLHILALGKPDSEVVEADVFLLTEQRPSIVAGPGVTTERSEPASRDLLVDLRSDKGMGWLPRDGMWLSYLALESAAGELSYDLAVDVSGGEPSLVDAGGESVADVVRPLPSPRALPEWPPATGALIAALTLAVALAGLLVLVAQRPARP